MLGTDSNDACLISLSIEWTSLTHFFSKQANEPLLSGCFLIALGSFISNWLAYLSRMELKGVTLGYSQYRDTHVIRPMGLACMYPATLGCGQLALLDAWPLGLLVPVIRAFCSVVVYFSTRLFPRPDFPSPKLLYTFTDINHI